MSVETPVLVQFPLFEDHRGKFKKVFTESKLKSFGFSFVPKEAFFSHSKKGVLRGMHFQTPPFEHGKLVTVITGRILDVVVDLRRSSPSYGQALSYDLNDLSTGSLFVPKGFAHGFYALQDTTVLYMTDAEYSPEHDAGILWDSIGFEWPDLKPMVSERDSLFLPLELLETPFL